MLVVSARLADSTEVTFEIFEVIEGVQTSI